MHQTLSSRRGEIDFHQQAALGDPERVLPMYRERIESRHQLLLRIRDRVAGLSPFLEIGAHAAHTSALLVNAFEADGVAVDIALPALKAAPVVAQHLGFTRAPLKVCCDAGQLPVKSNSFQCVVAFQTLHHFDDPEPVIREIRRVLAPGGAFVFAEEPVRRQLSLYLYKTRRVDDFNSLERWLNRWGLLRYLAHPYFGSKVEDAYGIVENQKISLARWRHMLARYFDAVDLDYSGVKAMGGDAQFLARLLTRFTARAKAESIAANLMGCELQGVCRVRCTEGEGVAVPLYTRHDLAAAFFCPDCRSDMVLDREGALACRACAYTSAPEDDVFNLLCSDEKARLYTRPLGKSIDFAQEGHEVYLGHGWHELSGTAGNRWRWMGKEASVQLVKDTTRPELLHIRGYVAPQSMAALKRLKMSVYVQGVHSGTLRLTDSGTFVYKQILDGGDQFLDGGDQSGFPKDIELTIAVDKVIKEPESGRELGLIISQVRLSALQ